ncbi:MAG: FtsW/RodA/SpoVE family cell cycle protein, partial [Pseudomonadota bacterium]
MLGRTDKNPIAEWWWTVDRLLLVFILALMTTGVILSLAASPPVALRLGLSEYHFVIRHIIFIIPAIAILIGVSILSPQNIRRLAALVFIGALVLTFATLVIGMEAKGAKRWLYLGGFSLQPSEFLKPAFLVLAAWLFAEGTKRPDVPATLIACL